MTEVPSEPMTVVSLVVDSFKRIRAVEVSPSATGLVPVRGRNRQGKSSLIQALQMALEGKRADVDEPINVKAHGAEVVVDLGGVVVRRKFKRGATGNTVSTLEVTGSNGVKFQSPQAVLDQLVGLFADPVAFLDMKPEDQVKTVLEVTGVSQPLSALQAALEMDMGARRDARRDASQAESALLIAEQEIGKLAAINVDDIVDTAALTDQLQAAHAHNATRSKLGSKIESLRREGTEVTKEIDAIEARLQQLIDRRQVLRDEYAKAVAVFDATDIVDTEPFAQRLAQAAEIEKAKAKLDNLTGLKKRADDLAAVAAAADERVEQTRADIAGILENADFPVDGMTYDADTKTLRLNGVPFQEASQAEAISVAARVAMAGDPKIRVLFVRNGSLLDADSMDALAEVARENGFQVWVEVVDESPSGPGVYIEDGEVVGGDDAASSRDGGIMEVEL